MKNAAYYNNFDALRFIAALIILLGHRYTLKAVLLILFTLSIPNTTYAAVSATPYNTPGAEPFNALDSAAQAADLINKLQQNENMQQQNRLMQLQQQQLELENEHHLKEQMTTTKEIKPMTCQQLMPHCSPDTDSLCIDTISGVMATPAICAPSLTLSAAVGILVHWAETHPKQLNMLAWDCVAKAYSEIFPCSKQKHQ